MAVKPKFKKRGEIMVDYTPSPTMASDTTNITNKEAETFISCNVILNLSENEKEFRDGNDTSAASLISDSSSLSEDSFLLHYYTLSEIKRHDTEASAWIVAGENIYDVTDYIEHHPGGRYSIMKKIGGVVDCTQDLLYHSKSGQKYWKQFLIGKVTKHHHKNRHPVEREWWRFWE